MLPVVPEVGKVIVAYRAPFAHGRGHVMVFEPNQTLSQMVAAFPDMPPDFFQRGSILIGGHAIDRLLWGKVRVKPGREVVFAYALAGGGGRNGGGGAGKAVLGIILAVATILTAGAAAAGFFGTAGGLFGAGTLSAKLLAGGISLIGALAQSALSKPPVSASNKGTTQDRLPGAASASGNVLGIGAPIPRVIGTRRVYPVLAAQPLVVRDGRDELAEAVFVLAGPHKIEDILIGDSSIDDADDITVQIREGWPSDQPIDLVERYAVTKTPSIELSAHDVDGDNQANLKNQIDPSKSIPKFHAVSSSVQSCDEIHFDMAFPEGLYNNSTSDRMRMAFRIRMRKTTSDPWISLPELHYASDDTREIRADIVLKWAPDVDAVAAFPSQEGWIAAYKAVSGQAAPATDAWTADASFSKGAGSDVIYRGIEAASNVKRVACGRFNATFLLDEGAIPKGSYQIEVKRSSAVTASSFDNDSYQYSGTVRDLFSYLLSGTTAQVVKSRQNLADRVYLLRVASIFNSHPIFGGQPGSGLTIIAAQAKNRSIDNLSVKASGYVQDWDGAGWNTWTTTSNPAPHYYDVLRGQLTPDPIDIAIIDNQSIVDWRTASIASSYTCDMLCEGAPIDDTLNKIAGCGYARPRMSETWGVIRDYDRSAEDPVQIFTVRNSRGLKMSKAFARLPDAFRVTWPDADLRDTTDEALVWREGRQDVPNPRIEQVTYDGFKTEAASVQRGTFDLKQGEVRSTFYSWAAPMESIVCQRGDLVGVNHGALDISHDAARVLDVEIASGNIVAFNLDATLQVYNDPDMHAVTNMHAVADMHLVGRQTSVSIRDADGVLADPMPVTGPSGLRSRLELTTPIAIVSAADDGDPLMREGNIAWVGKPGFEMLRLVLTDIKPGADFSATLQAVDEASTELFPA